MPWFGKISRQRPLHAVPISRLSLCTVPVPVNFAVLQMPVPLVSSRRGRPEAPLGGGAMVALQALHLPESDEGSLHLPGALGVLRGWAVSP
jgi:hypothetical protein